jgi:hypothetical protein
MFFDIILISFTHWLAKITGVSDQRNGDTFIPFEDLTNNQNNQQDNSTNHQDNSPHDFDDWGEF